MNVLLGERIIPRHELISIYRIRTFIPHKRMLIHDGLMSVRHGKMQKPPRNCALGQKHIRVGIKSATKAHVRHTLCLNGKSLTL